MAALDREQMLLDTLTAVTTTLVDAFDAVDLLQDLVDRCSTLLDADDAGIVLVDGNGELVVIASTDERLCLIEMLQFSSDDSPFAETIRTGAVVTGVSSADIGARWPFVAEAVQECGFQSTHSIPLRFAGRTIGALGIFRATAGGLDASEVLAAQAIADVATIALVHERTTRINTLALEQLQHALDSRIVIEQAKGMIAHRRGVNIDAAWDLLRAKARARHASISVTAHLLLENVITL
ncbi:GAF and ANTAR domain-containing protein [Rathayibacter tritici]|uniref:Transcriptional regulator n=1 Tax=Rathayibacter tritici TaxID=33888 RepID=A0A169C7Z4_9MICO|nr:GAF and ANTAR domain-containing protein [Rathayibacter tritici]AND18015.1 transcriptional regulator [Rathayibacter tritici]PPI47438.1 ANTAR domain-containing protein [Rathayibacter tritici]